MRRERRLIKIKIKVMYRFEKENELLFVELASILNTKGADIKIQLDFVENEVKHTNIPHIGSGHYGGNEGFNLKPQYDFFGMPLEPPLAGIIAILLVCI